MTFNLFSGDPQSQAMLALASGLLESGGPSRMPVGVGQGAARGMMQGREAFMAAQQEQQQQKLFDLKMQQVEQAKAAEAQRAAAIAQLSQDPRFSGLGPLLQVDPKAAIGQAYPEAKVVAPGGSLVAPNRPDSPLFTAPPKPPEDSPLAKLIKERDAIPQGDPRRAIYETAITKATTSQPLVNVDNRQGSAFDREVGEAFGKQYSDLLKADMSAPATIGKYQRLGSLLSNVNTGKFRGTIVDMKAAAKSMGFDLSAMGIPDDVAPAQAARALSNQIALELRNPAGGAGMPGALSDKDREFLIQSIPGLENDPKAIGTMIEYRTKLAKREQEVARMARAYRKKHGKFDEGFYDELAEWSNKNPLFPDAKLPSVAPAATPAAGVVDFGSLK